MAAATIVAVNWLGRQGLGRFPGSTDARIDAFSKGLDGNDGVVEALRLHLDREWPLFRNNVLLIPAEGRRLDSDEPLFFLPSTVAGLQCECWLYQPHDVGLWYRQQYTPQAITLVDRLLRGRRGLFLIGVHDQ